MVTNIPSQPTGRSGVWLSGLPIKVAVTSPQKEGPLCSRSSLAGPLVCASVILTSSFAESQTGKKWQTPQLPGWGVCRTPSCTHTLCDGTLLPPDPGSGGAWVAVARSTRPCTEPGETKPCRPGNKPGLAGRGLRERREERRPSCPAEAAEAGESPHVVGKAACSHAAFPPAPAGGQPKGLAECRRTT